VAQTDKQISNHYYTTIQHTKPTFSVNQSPKMSEPTETKSAGPAVAAAEASSTAPHTHPTDTKAEPHYEIPTHCKAGIVHNEGPNFHLTVELVPVPSPGPNDILIKLNCTGICYSDIHFMMNDMAIPKMSELGVFSPGHEGAGIVVKLGENVKNWKLGDRAGIKPLMDVCQSCEQCWAGKENYCQAGTHTGLMVPGNLPLSYITSLFYGTFLLTESRNVSTIPCRPRKIRFSYSGWYTR
jgi:hypothetical protein